MPLLHTCLYLAILLLASQAVDGLALSQPKGSAATPLQKKKVCVVGVGGYEGAVTYGFLQRAENLYGTGIGTVRAIGATADCATRLNRVLTKNFCLAFADESRIKLTNLFEVDSIASRLEGWDALVLGTDIGVNKRTVTGGTYEKTPNDRTYEIYWPSPVTFSAPTEEEKELGATILENVLEAAKQANIQHVCLVDEACNDEVLQSLHDKGLSYTCLRPSTELTSYKDYTYRVGAVNTLAVEAIQAGLTPSASSGTVNREDLAALAVQALQSLDWSQSRCLSVRSVAPPSNEELSRRNNKRPDQEWCVNSFLFEDSLRSTL